MIGFLQFLGSIFRHWLVLMSGGFVIVSLGIYERWQSANVSWSRYLVIIMVLIVFSAFLSWREILAQLEGARDINCELQSEFANLQSDVHHLRLKVEREKQISHQLREELAHERSSPDRTLHDFKVQRLRELIVENSRFPNGMWYQLNSPEFFQVKTVKEQTKRFVGEYFGESEVENLSVHGTEWLEKLLKELIDPPNSK